MKIIFIHSPLSWSWWRLLWKTNLITWYTCLNWAGTQSWLQHTKPSATPSRHRWPDCWNGNSPLSLCSVIILPRGLLYMSAQISLSVTSVNNGNKERTCRCRCVPPRQSTCHQEASPPPSPPSLPPHLVVGHLPEHRSDGSQPWGVVRVLDGAGEDQGWIPLTQPAPPTIAASDSFA